MTVDSKTLRKIVGEIVRQKSMEKGECTREELEEELQKMQKVGEKDNRRENGRINFEEKGNETWLSWKIIYARDKDELIHTVDSRGNMSKAGGSGETSGKIEKMVFNDEEYKVEQPVIDISEFYEGELNSELRKVISDYVQFRNSGRGDGEDWKYKFQNNFETNIRSEFDLKNLASDEVVDFVELLDQDVEGLTVPGFMIGGPAGGIVWDDFKTLTENNPEEAADVLSYLLDEESDLNDRLGHFYDFYGEIAEQKGASGGPLLGLATWLLMFAYPNKNIFYKVSLFSDFAEKYSMELDINQRAGYDIDQYIELRDYADTLKEALDDRMEEIDMLDVQDLLHFSKVYWLPEDIKEEIGSIKNYGQTAYGRLFALKCYLDMEMNNEEVGVEEESLRDEIKERFEEEKTPSTYRNSYTNLGMHFIKNYDLFERDENAIKPKEKSEDYLYAMKTYVDQLWSEVADRSIYFLVSHSENPKQLEEEYLKAPYTEDSEGYEPSHDLSKISEGDIILHYKDNKIKGYSKAQKEPEVIESDNGKEFRLDVNVNYFDEHRDFSNYGEILKKDWEVIDENYALEKREDGAIRKAQGYLKILTEESAKAIIEGETSVIEENAAKYLSEQKFEVEVPNDLHFEDRETLEAEIKASLNSGKNIIFTGPPGTGKTKLAKSIAKQVEESSNVVDGHIFTTATADWTAFDTIGGYMPSQGDGEELEFNPGQFLKCFRKENGEVTNKWLVIDEINRSDIDKAFGQLFSILSGDSVELPYKKDGHVRLEKVDEDDNAEEIEGNEDIYPVTDSWRLIATMNTYDKTSLYDMSYAFMRRFNFIHVGVPELKTDGKYRFELLDPEIDENYAAVWNAEETLAKDDLYEDLTVLWNEVNRQRDIGPSIIKDIIEFIEAHEGSNDTALAQAVNSLILPQFEGLRREKQKKFVRKLKSHSGVDEKSINVEASLVKEKAVNMFNISLDDE